MEQGLLAEGSYWSISGGLQSLGRFAYGLAEALGADCIHPT